MVELSEYLNRGQNAMRWRLACSGGSLPNTLSEYEVDPSVLTAYCRQMVSLLPPSSMYHVLLDCPNLRDLRRELRGRVGEAFNSVSTWRLSGRREEAN